MTFTNSRNLMVVCQRGVLAHSRCGYYNSLPNSEFTRNYNAVSAIVCLQSVLTRNYKDVRLGGDSTWHHNRTWIYPVFPGPAPFGVTIMDLVVHHT